jgi:hypothetical protein
MPKLRFRVPQKDGEIVVNRGGDVTTYTVRDGVISVDEEHAATVRGDIAGAEPVDDKAAAAVQPQPVNPG